MTTPSSNHVVTATVRVAASVMRVWQAITDPAELTLWYAPGSRWEIPALRVGAPVRFFNSETDIQHAVIERCAPPDELVLRWTPDQTLPTATLLNTYELRHDDGGTLVTISQTGYGSVPEAQRAAWIRADEGAFAAIASALAAHLR
jgi:uncharacterized protein YndB with AHSA1/START domain